MAIELIFVTLVVVLGLVVIIGTECSDFLNGR